MANTLITFDSNDTSGYALVDFGGSSSSVASTPPTGASGQAVMVTKGAAGTPSEGWAGTTFLDLASGEFITPASHIVTMKVWSPDAGTVVRLKLEDKTNPTHTIESDATTTVAGGWQTLTFDMANAATNGGNPTAPLNDAFTFNRATVFFAFGSAGTGQAYYFDDVSYNAAAPTPTPAPTPVPVVAAVHVTFDAGDTSGYAFTDFGGAGSLLAATPPAGGSGKAAQVVKSVGAETWAGTTFLSLGSSEMITTADKTVTMKVWSPDAGTVVRLKLEDSADVTHTVETDATTTVAGGWQTLTFNFANQASSTAAFNDAFNYNKASVFFAFGSGGSGKTYYFDDVAYAQSPTGSVMTGTAAADTMTGTSGAEWLFGLAGNDHINGKGGNDSVDGGSGTDTLVLQVTTADVLAHSSALIYAPGSISRIGSSLGTVDLTGVERIQLNDGLYAFDTAAPSGNVPGGHVWQAAALYHLGFGAMPDQAALSKWSAQADASASMGELGQKIIDFYAPGISSTDLVNYLYQMLVHAAPPAGVLQGIVSQIGQGQTFATQGDLFAYAASLAENTNLMVGFAGSIQTMDPTFFG